MRLLSDKSSQISTTYINSFLVGGEIKGQPDLLRPAGPWPWRPFPGRPELGAVLLHFPFDEFLPTCPMLPGPGGLVIQGPPARRRRRSGRSCPGAGCGAWPGPPGTIRSPRREDWGQAGGPARGHGGRPPTPLEAPGPGSRPCPRQAGLAQGRGQAGQPREFPPAGQGLQAPMDDLAPEPGDLRVLQERRFRP